jgi:hypothetical protein
MPEDHATAKLVIDGLVAAGTIAVAVLAIWGEQIRSILAPPKLLLQPHNLKGDPTRYTSMVSFQGTLVPVGGDRVMFYHLKVVNLRPSLTVTNCQVLLKAMSRRGPDGQFHPVPLTVAIPFIWSLPDITPPLVTITKEQILDFGKIGENDGKFSPALRTITNNFGGYVATGEAVRYHLEIDGSNFASTRPQIFEVAWDGQWHHEPETMSNHLTIREITSQST